MAIKVLVLSDVDFLREAVASALSEQIPPIQIIQSKNPIDGLIQAQEQKVSLIYCGTMLTGFSGAKFMEELHKHAPHIPVIVISTGEPSRIREDENAISAMLCLGAAKYLKYPFTAREAVAAAQNVINVAGCV